MWLFLAALAMLFLTAIAGYLVVRLRAEAWPPPGMPRLPSGLWVSSLLVVLGSVTVHRALAAVRAGERTACVRWLAATTALAVAFLVSQTWNWWDLVAAKMPATTRNLYAFTFYMLTGLHAAHVVGGVILLVVVTVKARLGKYGSGYHPGVLYATMYQHFLGGAWLVIWGILIAFA